MLTAERAIVRAKIALDEGVTTRRDLRALRKLGPHGRELELFVRAFVQVPEPKRAAAKPLDPQPDQSLLAALQSACANRARFGRARTYV